MPNVGKWTKKFSHNDVRNWVAYTISFNTASQVITYDASNKENIQSTGTKPAWIAGRLIKALPADAEMDISAEAPYANWATATSYTLNSEVVCLVTGFHYTCQIAHTSSAATKPNAPGQEWQAYWKKLDVWAVDATGDIITTATTKYFLVCALDDGTLRIFKAYNSLLALEIPAFDPDRYVPLAVVSAANATGSDWICGTDLWDEASMTVTFQNVIGPLYPDGDLVDKN